MRFVVVTCVLAACAPDWRIENVATARASTKADAACIEAGLGATGHTVMRGDFVARPAVGWYVMAKDLPPIRVWWDPDKPQRLDFAVTETFSHPRAGYADGYRSVRDSAIASIEKTCGPFDVGPETCAQVECKPVQSSTGSM